MSKKLLRLLTLSRYLQYRPYKLTASQLQKKLEQENIHVSLRTVQRDLEEMSAMAFFGLTSDERSKPHGWYFEHREINDSAQIITLSLAVALKTWCAQASHLLPISLLAELNPILDNANKVLSESNSEQVERWLDSMYQSSHLFVSNQAIRNSTLLREAHWVGRKFSAKIQRDLKRHTVWLHYSHINPLEIIYKQDDSILLCTLSEIDPKIYEISFKHIKDVELTCVSATRPKYINLRKPPHPQEYNITCSD